MKLKNILALVVAVVVVGYWLFSPSPYDVGDVVDDFSLGTVDGERLYLNELSGKAVFIEFFSTTCPVSKTAFPQTERLRAKFENNPNVAFISINRGEPCSRVQGYVDGVGKPWPILLDPERNVYEQFFDKGVPAFAFIDREHKLRFKQVGWWVSSTEGVNHLAFEIQKALAGS